MGESRQRQKGSALVISETPLQLFNAIALLCGDEEFRRFDRVDLVLVEQFRVTEELLNALSNSSLFSTVTTIPAIYTKYIGAKSIGITLERVVSESLHYKRFGDAYTLPELQQCGYECVIAGVATLYFMDLKLKYAPDAYTYFYEEGEGSYCGNFVKSVALFDGELLIKPKTVGRRVFGYFINVASRGRLVSNAERLYLYDPQFVAEGIYRNLELRPMPKLQGSAAERLHAMLGTSLDEDVLAKYSSCDAVVFGLPGCDLSQAEDESMMAALSQIKASCGEAGLSVMFRPHPRSTRQELAKFYEIFGEAAVDSTNSMWELILASGAISERALLIGFGSSAQSNPARMFAIPATSIYIHNLIPNGRIRECAEYAFGQQEQHGGSSAVLSVDTLEDLDIAINDFASGGLHAV